MKFNQTTLPNGLKIITIPLHDAPTVTVLVMVETGSKYETKNINGLSHFLEHMCFKGTKKRPSALVISHELDALGAQSNAFTSQEFTGYFAKAHKKHFLTLLDVVSDIYLNPVFNEKEIEKEKGVIIEEINMYQDMPQRHIYDLFFELLYGDQPAGWPIAGPKENIRILSRKDFIDYRAAHYVASGTAVIVAGNINEEETKEHIVRLFSAIPATPKEDKKPVVEKQEKPEILVKHKDTDQTHLMLGVRAFPIHHPDAPTLRVLSTILGGGMSSRLFQKLREQMGVAYYARSEADFYTDHGHLAITTGVDKKRVEEVLSEILQELDRLKKEPVPQKELDKAKDYLVGTMYLELESSDSIAEYYGYQNALRRPLQTPEEFADKIKAVTAEDIIRVAKDIITNSRLNCAVIGDISSPDMLREKLVLPS
ncbi:MAG: pitrilysin family protein [Patescibacteria group bacterium]|nr:pitrilysin family protein [bacterium]MDZ4241024.1 pitrilysin family protein [Patescibacteria group bacterium]